MLMITSVRNVVYVQTAHAVCIITGAAVARGVPIKIITYLRNVVYVKHPSCCVQNNWGGSNKRSGNDNDHLCT